MRLPATDPNSDVMFTIFGSAAFSRLGRKCLHVKKGPWTISVRITIRTTDGLTTAMVWNLSENICVVCSCQAFGWGDSPLHVSLHLGRRNRRPYHPGSEGDRGVCRRVLVRLSRWTSHPIDRAQGCRRQSLSARLVSLGVVS
jgi:hypothetical protein